MNKAILYFILCICFINLFFCHGGKNISESRESIQSVSDNPRSGFEHKGENGHLSPNGFRPNLENDSMNHLEENEIRPDRSGKKTQVGFGYETKTNLIEDKEFKDVSNEFEHRHREHGKGIKRIFLEIILVIFIIALIVGSVYVGVIIVNKILRWNEKRRLEREQKRITRVHAVNTCHCNFTPHPHYPQGPQNPGNNHNTSNSTVQPILPQSTDAVNNLNTCNNHQDYEVVNVNSNSNREINQMIPEVTYPKLDQVNSCHNVFSGRLTGNSNKSSRPAAEFMNAPQLNVPLLK
jgi:hypothetical protein